MRLLSVFLFVFLTGCATTVPVTVNFPSAVPELMKQCEDLKKVEVNGPVSITDLLKVVIANYSLYYQCANKVDGWQEWYNEQKKIFESAK